MCTKIDFLAKTRGNVKPKTTPLLAKLVYGSEDLDHVPAAIKWGKENEDKALSDFHAIALSKHRNCKLAKSSLHVMKGKPYIGASPDELISCSCCGEATVEIKCPYCIRDLTENWEKSDFLVLKNTILLKKEHKYDYQLMGLMGVCGIPKCYLLVWTLMELHIEVFEFDPGFWPNVLLKLELFLRHIIMAKVMLGLHVIYFCAVCEKPILEGEELPVILLTTVFAVIIVLYGSTFTVCKSAALRKTKSGSARLAWRIS